MTGSAISGAPGAGWNKTHTRFTALWILSGTTRVSWQNEHKNHIESFHSNAMLTLFIVIVDPCLIDMLLYNSPNFVVNGIQVRAVG